MKITEDIITRLEKALDMRKKDGTPIWSDDQEIEINIAGTFANDKFIVINKKRPREESTPDLTLKAHHSKLEI
jgi:frataxin-like iron-binding protein CyaY